MFHHHHHHNDRDRERDRDRAGDWDWDWESGREWWSLVSVSTTDIWNWFIHPTNHHWKHKEINVTFWAWHFSKHTSHLTLVLWSSANDEWKRFAFIFLNNSIGWLEASIETGSSFIDFQQLTCYYKYAYCFALRYVLYKNFPLSFLFVYVI